jgi:serine/threonine protein kinase/Tol biopolymer transport system component
MTPDRWQQIEQLFHAALEHAPNDRAAFLRDACAGDDSLLREIESLLAQETAADRLLEVPARDAAANMSNKPQAQSFVGRQVGSYQVISLLGVGGMGEVYEARDTKLGRTVAIKVLPEEFIHDPERLARFQREAKMLASLNHPNIATIFGLEQFDGVHYLVMELVPGQTLAERITKGALPLNEALKLAAQIAEALEAAHEKGVIHRDLKPANVKVTPEGRVKVLDFGLAKTFRDDSEPDLSQAPTLSEEGRILGTPAYMSPEQARGLSVDKRTDIWAFGCVLYELLTGEQAFQGDTLSDCMAAVLEREPDWQALPASIPAKIRGLLRRCLQKELRSRLRDIGDARIEIEEAFSLPVPAEPVDSSALFRSVSRRTMILGLACVAIAAAIVGTVILNLKSRPTQALQPMTRMVIRPPGEHLLGGEDGSPVVALSPDGTHLVSVVRQGGATQLYTRRMDQLEFAAIPGTEGGINPFFSPDGQWLGFYSVPDAKLEKMPISGGTPQNLCDTAQIHGASWGPDGTIIFSSGLRGNFGLFKISGDGGTPQPLTTPDSKHEEIGHMSPAFLPNGKAILFTIQYGNIASNDYRIVVQSLETGTRRMLIKGGIEPRYALSGHLIYVQGGTIMAAPFNISRLELTGAPVAIQDGLAYGDLFPQFTFSNLGMLVYEPTANGEWQPERMVWVDRKGVSQDIAAPPGSYQFPRLSPAGNSVAVQVMADKTDVWIYDLTRDTLTRLTSQGNNSWPIWTPDGKRITFTSNRSGPENLFWKLADGSGLDERLTTSEHHQVARSWSPDGQELVFEDLDPVTNDDLWVLPIQGNRKPWPFLRTPFPEGWARLSPDGRWLAYVSKELAQTEVFVQPFPSGTGKWQISTAGATEPMWSRDGRQLFYRSGDKMLVVDIAKHPTFSAGKPRLLFESAEYDRVSTTADYDVSPDGQRFLMIQELGRQSAAPYDVVVNWFDELKRRAPLH